MAYIKPTMSCAAAFPWSAALRNQKRACTSSCGMPWPWRTLCRGWSARGRCLIGQRTQELHRRREVAVLICGVEVLKRPCLCFAEQGERENAASQESCDLPFHSAHATDTKRRAEGGVLGPSPSARAVKRGARPASDPASVAESRRARIDMGQRPGFSARFGFHSSSSVTCTQRSMLTIANRKRDPHQSKRLSPRR